MYNLSSVSIITKAGLLIGVMLAVFLLSSRLYDSAHARTAPEQINYEEGRTDAVAAFTAVDPEGGTIDWTLDGTDAGDFDITGGALTFLSTPDYENPVDDDPDNTYEVTVQVADASNQAAIQSLVVNVIDVDEDGVVDLSALQPQEKVPLMATLTDADGGPGDSLPLVAGNTNLTDDTTNINANTKWRWSRSSSKTGTFTDIVGILATSKDYTPVLDDVGMYLRATATYDDREGEGKSAHMVSANPVRAKPYENASPVFNDEYGDKRPNEVPLDRSVPENSASGTLAGDPVVATDDARDVLTYTLVNAGTAGDAAFFTIDSSGQIRVGPGVSIDYEDSTNTDHEYEVKVIAADPDDTPDTPDTQSRDTITVTIAVIDVDEAPVIAAPDLDASPPTGVTAKDYAENQETTMVVSTYSATDPEDGNDTPVRWSLSGADSSKFSIDTNGALTFDDSPDFEAEADANSDNIYEVTVTATDSTGNTASRSVTVNVTNVEEDGTVTLSTLQPEAGTQLRADLTDPDVGITGIRWQWYRETGTIGDDTNRCSAPSPTTPCAIDDANTATYTPDNDDEGSNLTARATYTDGEGADKSAESASANRVKGKDTGNKAPKFPDQDPDRAGDQSSSTSRMIPENTGPGEDIGDPVIANDCDAPTPAEQDQCNPNTDTLTYSLEGRDKDSFSILRSSGQLQTKAALDYETKRSYTVTVKATDPTNASETISVTITVDDEPEKPVISGSAPGTYAENGTAPVAAFTARDPDRPPRRIEWTLAGTDAGDFTITNGTLRFNSPPDFEAPKGGEDPGSTNTYAVTVRASDGGDDTTATKDVEIRVLNVEEPGTVTLSNEQPKDGVELTATLTDPDRTGTDTLTGPDGTGDPSWQWAQSSSRTGTFTNIRNATDAAYTPVGGDDPDTEAIVEVSDVSKYLRATVTYKDPQSTRVTKTAFFVATRPVLKKTYMNTAPVFPDQDPDMTGVQDGATTRTIPETAAPRTAVGSPVAATDMGETRLEVLTYTLSDTNTDSGDAALFYIDRIRGQIRVGQGTVLNYSGDTAITDGNNKASYEVTVTATDPNGKGTTIAVTINVTNVDEAPSVTVGPTTITQPEGKAGEDRTVIVDQDPNTNGIQGATYEAADPEDDRDADESLKWSLSGNDADLFCIGNGTTRQGDFTAGELRFKASPNFETPADAGHNNVYNVTVVVTDSRGNTATRDVVVTVTNVEEAGKVILSTVQPEDGEVLSTVLSDLDGRTTGVKWQWYRSEGGDAANPETTAPVISGLSLLYSQAPDTSDWVLIEGKTSATYTPVSADVGKFLLVTATYTDRKRNVTADDSDTDEDETKDQARVASANAVQGPDTNNKPPKFPDLDLDMAGDQKDQTREVAEGTAAGEDVGGNDPVVAKDCDHAVDQNQCQSNTESNTDKLTYSLSGTDAPSFSIERGTGQLLTKAPLDYETKQTYTVTVTATDPSKKSDTITVTITVTGVNEPPTLSKRALVISGQSNVDHPENDRNTVATYTGAGPQATRVSWSLLGDDDGDFSISGGRLTFRATPNYESPADRNTDNSYHVTIRAAGGGFTATRAVTVRVVNVDEGGTVSLSSSRAAVGVGLTATLTDPDGRSGDEPPITGAETDLTDDAAWQWSKSPDGSTGWTTIAGANANTYTPDQDDVGSYLQGDGELHGRRRFRQERRRRGRQSHRRKAGRARHPVVVAA